MAVQPATAAAAIAKSIPFPARACICTGSSLSRMLSQARGYRIICGGGTGMPAVEARGARSGGQHAIFLSYRRSDTGGYAFALFQELQSRFGEDVVFYDKDSIRGGDKFTDLIKQSVRDCHAFVAVISRDWLTVQDGGGRRRLDDPEDLVRCELALALELGKKVLPVLFEVEADGVPKKEALPGPLRALADADYLQLRGKTSDYRTQ